MVTLKIDNNKPGWVKVPGNTHTVVAHFNDGTEKRMLLAEFLVMNKMRVVSVDCYRKDEITD